LTWLPQVLFAAPCLLTRANKRSTVSGNSGSKIKNQISRIDNHESLFPVDTHPKQRKIIPGGVFRIKAADGIGEFHDGLPVVLFSLEEF